MGKSPSLQPSLASTVQPQRRGRPTRDTARESPRPTAVQTQQARWQQSPVQQAQQKPQMTSGSANVRAPSRLHITGESASLSSGSAPLSTTSPPPVDAFGMPIVSSTQPTATGFGDSFGAGASLVRPTGTTGSSQPSQSRYGSNFIKRPTGFGDSFGSGIARTPSISSRSSAPVKRVPSGATTVSSKQHSPAVSHKSPEPPSAGVVPEGDLSFESRFPSIETLNSEATLSPPEKLISPVVSPPSSSDNANTTPGSTTTARGAVSYFGALRPRPLVNSRPSMSRNLTGGHTRVPDEDGQAMQGEAEKHGHVHVQPRSTQVTGTAFRGQVSGLAPNLAQGGGREGRGYYHGEEEDAERERREEMMKRGDGEQGEKWNVSEKKIDKKTITTPEDLMGSEESGSLRIPSIVPVRSISPASATSAAMSATSAMNRGPPPLDIDAAKTGGGTNILSDNWSPLAEMRKRDVAERAEAAVRKKEAEAERAQLERQNAADQPPFIDDGKLKSPKSVASTAQPPVAPSEAVSPEPIKSTTLPVPTSRLEPSTGQVSQRIPSRERARPQSMFLPSTSSNSVPSRSSLLSPPLRSEPSSLLPSSQSPPKTSISSPSRPSQGHQKKDSINGMVSKYESISIGKPGEDTNKRSVRQHVPKPSEGTNALASKPFVASKPVGLRKPSADLDNSAPVNTTTARNEPANPTKPRVASKPSTFRQDPAVGVGYIRPGMSANPSVRPNPVVSTSFNSSNPDHRGKEDEVVEKDKSAVGSSPEKQQPVNLLIQRWNKGEVNNASGNAAAKFKKGGYI